MFQGFVFQVRPGQYEKDGKRCRDNTPGRSEKQGESGLLEYQSQVCGMLYDFIHPGITNRLPPVFLDAYGA